MAPAGQGGECMAADGAPVRPAADDGEAARIRQARGRFLAMAAAYALGTFNDNYFRQSVIFLAIAAGRPELRGVAAALFPLPFVLAAAPAGWLADRFPKRRVVIGAKTLELAAVLCGAAGVLTGSWPLLLGMVFLMGLQACFFSPALNGSLPELYPAGYVLTANSRLRMAVTAAILAGILCSGASITLKTPFWFGVPLGRWIIAGVMLAVSLAGLAAGFGVPVRPAADPARRFPWSGPVETWRWIRHIHQDRLLGVIVWTDVWIWTVGSLQMLLVVALGPQELGWSEGKTSFLVFAVLAGTAAGAWLSARLATGPRWHRVLAPSQAVQALLALPLPLLLHAAPPPARDVLLFALMAVLGITGGLIMIPCESFVQVRPAAAEKGAVLSAANFLIFCGIIFSGVLVYVADTFRLCRPSVFLMGTAVVSLPAAALLHRLLAKEPRGASGA